MGWCSFLHEISFICTVILGVFFGFSNVTVCAVNLETIRRRSRLVAIARPNPHHGTTADRMWWMNSVGVVCFCVWSGWLPIGNQPGRRVATRSSDTWRNVASRREQHEDLLVAPRSKTAPQLSVEHTDGWGVVFERGGQHASLARVPCFLKARRVACARYHQLHHLASS